MMNEAESFSTVSCVLSRQEGANELVPGLPNCIVLDCVLPWVPWYARAVLAATSKAWKQALHEPCAYSELSRRVRSMKSSKGMVMVHQLSEQATLECYMNMNTRRRMPRPHAISVLEEDDNWRIAQQDTVSQHPIDHTWSWRKLPPIPAFAPLRILQDCGVVCVDGKIFVIGGWDPRTDAVHADVYMLDIAAGLWEWEAMAPMHFARAFFHCTAMANKIYVVGGTSSPCIEDPDPEVFDADTHTWAILPRMTWGNQNTEKEAHEQLCYAFDNGINILDTAEMYPVPVSKDKQGNTDRIINPWLKTRARDKVIVATKVSGYSNRETSLRDNSNGTRVDAANIKESVEKSLKRLGTDYIDLLQIHWPDRYVPLFGEYLYDVSKWRESIPFSEQLQALQDVIKEGKVRYIGVSNETSYGVMEFVHLAKTMGLPKIISIQNSYSLLVRCAFEVNLVEVCDSRHCNVGLLAYSPLAGGVLSGKYLDMNGSGAKQGRLSLFPGYMDRYLKSLASEAVKKYVDLAQRYGMTPAQLALAFVRDQPYVTSSIIGATTMEQLKENLSAYRLPRPLSTEIMVEINEIFSRYRDPALI